MTHCHLGHFNIYVYIYIFTKVTNAREYVYLGINYPICVLSIGTKGLGGEPTPITGDSLPLLSPTSF